MDHDRVSKALGVLGIMIGLGPILGPTIGGFFLALNVWRLIFWINVPFAILGLICNYLLIHQIHENTAKQRFDLSGSIINATMIICLLAVFSLLSKATSFKLAVPLIICGLVLGVCFYTFEFRLNEPLVDFRTLSKAPKIWLYLLQTAVFGFASAIVFLIPPFLFEKVMHIDVGVTGLLVLGAPVGLVIFSRVSGSQNDGSKNQKFSRWGLVVIALAFAGLLLVGVQWPPIVVTSCLFLFGVGGGYFQPANIGNIMQSGSANSQGTIGSLQRMVQNIAIASGTAIGSTLINLTSPNLFLGIQVNWYLALFVVVIIVIADILINFLYSKNI